MGLRARILQRAVQRTWVQWLIILWTIVSAYDLFGSQLLPESVSQNLPKVREMIAATSGYLPWWGWAFIGMALVTTACVEYLAQDKLRESRDRLVGLKLLARPAALGTAISDAELRTAHTKAIEDQTNALREQTKALAVIEASPEQLKFVSEAFSRLPPESIVLLREMLLTGRITKVEISVWQPLHDAGLVERDLVGAGKIKSELTPAVAAKLKEIDNDTRMRVIALSASGYGAI